MDCFVASLLAMTEPKTRTVLRPSLRAPAKQSIFSRHYGEHRCRPCARRNPYAVSLVLRDAVRRLSHKLAAVVMGPCVRRDDAPVRHCFPGHTSAFPPDAIPDSV